MAEEINKRRVLSPERIAFGNERKLMLAVRRQIGELQKRAAFVEARAMSARAFDAEAAGADVGQILNDVADIRVGIEAVMQGVTGVGPAEDCRKALNHLCARLATIQAVQRKKAPASTRETEAFDFGAAN